MAANFSQPQRQSPIGVLVMFFYTLQVYAKALWPILLVTILKIEKYNKY
jgi:putative membrane protein